MPHIDTLATARRLEQSGLPTEQARAVSEAIADAVREAQPDLSEIATKGDLAALKEWVKELVRAEVQGLRADNQQTRAELRSDQRMQMVWFFVMLVGLFGAGLAIVRMFPWPSR
jgi:hypothetical protein